MYDVIIIGAGVTGGSIACYLARFKLKCLILEKHNDVGEETSSANSAIVHSGYDPKPGTVKAKFNVLGCQMMPKVCEELDVAFNKIGSLTVGFNDEDHETLEGLLKRAQENNVKARIVEQAELREMEPNISDEAQCALFCEDAGIVNPFGLTVSFIENALDNGCELKLNHEVEEIQKIDGIYKVICKNGEMFETKVLVNASGQNSASIHSLVETPNYKIATRKGEYILLDHFNANWVKHTLFMCPTKVGKGVLVSPTTSFNYIVGPSNDLTTMNDTSTDAKTFDYLKIQAQKLIKNIPYQETIREFAGVRANPDTDDFIIEESKENKGFFEVGGIMSPGLASSPAIGEYVSNLIQQELNLEVNKNYNPLIRKHESLKTMSAKSYNEFIKQHPEYGNFICRCEKVTEGEIVDVIHRNCGAHTVKGVKKRTRAGFGKCQGTFCQEEVIKILARELHVSTKDINYSELGTNVMKYVSKNGEYDE
jgi:glycerol-3-phosphate dehydrogenase